MAPNYWLLPPINHFSGPPPSLPALKQVVAFSEGHVHLLTQQINRRVDELDSIFPYTKLPVDETGISYFWNKLAGMQAEGSVHDSLTFIDSKIPFGNFDTCYGDENKKLNNSVINNYSKQRSIDVILNFHFQKMQLVIKMIDSEISWAEEVWSNQFIKILESIDNFDIKSSERQFKAALKKYEDVMFNLLWAKKFLNRVQTSIAIPSGNYPDVFGAMANGIDMTYTRDLSRSTLR